MTEAQRYKLVLLGGAEWVRQRINKARMVKTAYSDGMTEDDDRRFNRAWDAKAESPNSM